ncbi:MAG: hypothetical protein WBM08_05355, partial [Prochlorococcaceae cyanobacterium]
LGGRLAGGAIGGRTSRHLPDAERLERASSGAGMGGMAGGMLANFVPAPFTNSLYQREGQKQQNLLMAQAKQQALAEMGQTGFQQPMAPPDVMQSGYGATTDDMYRRMLMEGLLT